MRHIASSAFGRPETVFLPYWNGNQLFNAQDSLSWFAGGSFILGGTVTSDRTLLDFGLGIADTAGAVYGETATGLGAEFIVWTANCDAAWGEETCTANNSIRLSTPSFKLRPEVVETWYYAYRATGDGEYQDLAWSVFVAVEKFCRTETGFSAISDVNAADGGDKLDEQPSFLFAELLKYLWLIQFDVNVSPSRLRRRSSD